MMDDSPDVEDVDDDVNNVVDRIVCTYITDEDDVRNRPQLVGAELAEMDGRHRFISSRLAVYLVGCAMATGTSATLAIYMWSGMGGEIQHKVLDILYGREHWATYCAFFLFALVFLLYVVDFFAPVHLPGRYLVVSESMAWVGKGCLGLVVAAVVVWSYLMAKDFPTLPLVITTFLCPLSIILLRWVTLPKVPERPFDSNGVRGLQDKIYLIKLLTWEERDEHNFYIAALSMCMTTGVAVFAVWTTWALRNEAGFKDNLSTAPKQADKELVFVRWSAPLCVAISNFVFAGFAALRVTQSGAYSATDQIKNQLLFDFESSDHKRVEKYRIAMLRARIAGVTDEKGLKRAAVDKLQRYLVQHIWHMRRLSKIVKSVNATLIGLIVALHVVFQMVTTVSHIAVMVQGYLASYLVTFVVFTFVSFNRVTKSMSLDLMYLPMFKTFAGYAQTDWGRGLVMCFGLPMMPLLLCMSLANQTIRRQRRLTSSGNYLTKRVQNLCEGVRKWEWIPVLGWMYIISGVLIVFRIFPVFLNVLLAWVSSTLGALNFWTICAAMFLIGTFLFMLPPVPGPIIYPFAGFLLSDPEKCPFGFWGGCAVSIILSFVMKMSACALQQKVIGEALGGNVSVQRVCGVHKPGIRAIEAVLKQPGLSWGKCAILCGGPDWPTSVLAGILRLSLRQCLIGTCPVILSIIPMTLTGSLYLKRSESEAWTRTGNLMLLVTTAISAIFWVGIGWALQDEFDKRGDALTRPNVKHLELEWADYRQTCIFQRCRPKWMYFPTSLRLLYAGGAIIATFVAHIFLWCASRCFGNFTVIDSIDTLRWFGDGGLLRPLGIVCLVLFVICCSGPVVYQIWYKAWRRDLLKQVLADLEEEEPSWKREWLEHASRVNDTLAMQRCSSQTPTVFSCSDIGSRIIASRTPTLLSNSSRAENANRTKWGSAAVEVGSPVSWSEACKAQDILSDTSPNDPQVICI